MQMQAYTAVAGQLQLGLAPRPEPGPGQLLVKVAAAGVNRADLVQVAGLYPPPPGESSIIGLEIAGEVVALGPQVQGFRPGQAVFGLVAGGAYAEYCLLDQSLAWLQPDTLSSIQAASLPEVWLTAWLNLVTLGQLGPGQRALIHAGASGVGAAAIQLAKAQGAWVAATASSPAKLDFCRGLGADCVINYREQDFAAELKAIGGVDLILDPVGGSYLAGNQRCLRLDGRLIVIGLLGGVSAELNLGQLLVKRQQLLGSTLRSLPLARKAELAQALARELLPQWADGRLQLSIDRVFAWQDAPAAHAYLAQNQNLGKVVLNVA
ncbi:NAD(P)H-quinone oxidoreductase [Chitinibacter tainanensis]|uniref:NAD(P)H-quinone oxidoreductase n=1 Tax=Chitinibacter tainanensis TaxID=230667 RepID=UPI0023535463|nr:NAD(P)H-quinone oxidoreductase [Chitinibacter tainanensis]